MGEKTAARAKGQGKSGDRGQAAAGQSPAGRGAAKEANWSGDGSGDGLLLPDQAWPASPAPAPELPAGLSQGPPPRPVELLNGLDEIAGLFAVSPRRVRTWERLGAPLYRDQKGVARAERLELWEWFKANCGQPQI